MVSGVIPAHLRDGIVAQLERYATALLDCAAKKDIWIGLDYQTDDLVVLSIGAEFESCPEGLEEYWYPGALVVEERQCVTDFADVIACTETVIDTCLNNGLSTTGHVRYLLKAKDDESLDVTIYVEVVEGALKDGLFSRLKNWALGPRRKENV